MNTPLSLVQELRGIRGGQKQGQSDLNGLLSEIREARREWQEQVDQAQQLLHELLAAVADLSGVQLPGMAIGTGKDGDGSLRLGFKTLKDRIQNELEGFASTSAAEVAKKFQGQSSIVFEPLEKEMSARMDNLADEFRGKLQSRLEAEQNGVAEKAKVRTEEMLQSKMGEFAEWIKLMTEGAVSSVPAEVQRSLEPHVEQVKDRLKNTFQQHLNMVVLEAERAALGKVEEIKKEVQGLVGGLSEQARQACLHSTDQAMKDFNMRIGAVAQESTRQLEAGSRAYADENLNNFKAQLTGLSATSKEEFQTFANSHVNGYKEKLLAAAQELQQKSAADIASNVQKASRDALNSSLSQVKQRIDEALEQSKGELKSTMGTMVEDVRKQMSDSAASARDSLAGDANRLSGDLRGLGEQLKSTAASARDSLAGDASALSAELKSLGEQLKASENQRITAMTDSMASLSRQALERHSQTIKQVADSQIEEIQKSLSGLQARMAVDYEAQLRQFIAEQRKAMVEEIQKQVADASTYAVDKIRSSSGQVVQDLSGKVNKEVNTATTLLNQWAHQTTTWAEASIKESLESYKRQVAEFTSDLMQEQRTKIQNSIGDLQGRLEQAANLLRAADGVAPETRRAKDHQQA